MTVNPHTKWVELALACPPKFDRSQPSIPEARESDDEQPVCTTHGDQHGNSEEDSNGTGGDHSSANILTIRSKVWVCGPIKWVRKRARWIFLIYPKLQFQGRNLQATPVNEQGLPECEDPKNLQWVGAYTLSTRPS